MNFERIKREALLTEKEIAVAVQKWRNMNPLEYEGYNNNEIVIRANLIDLAIAQAQLEKAIFYMKKNQKKEVK